MKDSPQTSRDILQTLDRFAAERRRFLAEGSVYGTGILASLGLSQYVRAQGAPPPGRSGTAAPGSSARHRRRSRPFRSVRRCTT